VVRGGGIRAERWRGDKGCCLCPVLTPVMEKKLKVSNLTPFPSESNDISGTLAHHLGDVEGTVGLIGYGDRAVYCLSLHLQIYTVIYAHRCQTHPHFSSVLFSGFKVSGCFPICSETFTSFLFL
uniref:Uncharacterized protein n=1 Tax=Amphiprion percula TaxID=161767 RepID=A0A3P8T2E4_AMPPE